MRNLALASCLALGFMLSSSGLSTAQADHGYGYRAPACGYGHGGRHGGYSANYGRYPNAFAAPGLSVYSRSVYSAGRVGYPSAFGGYGAGYGGGYAPVVVPGFGNPAFGGYGTGYGGFYGRQSLPRVQLRIGF